MKVIGDFQEMEWKHKKLDYEELETLILDILDEFYGKGSAGIYWERVEEKGQKKWKLEYLVEFEYECVFKTKVDCLEAFYEKLLDIIFEEEQRDEYLEWVEEMKQDYERSALNWADLQSRGW